MKVCPKRYAFDFDKDGNPYFSIKVPFKVQIVVSAARHVLRSYAFDSLRLNFEDVHIYIYRKFTGENGKPFGYIALVSDAV